MAATNKRLTRIFNLDKVEMGDEEVNVMFLFCTTIYLEYTAYIFVTTSKFYVIMELSWIRFCEFMTHH